MIKSIAPETKTKNKIETMAWREIKKYLRSIGVGGFVAKNADLYDPVFEIQAYAIINRDVQVAKKSLKADGIPIGDTWLKNGFECDDQHLLIQAEMKKIHIKENLRSKDFMSRAFGFAAGEQDGQGHAFNVGICLEGFFIWNYGNPVKSFSGWQADDRIVFL